MSLQSLLHDMARRQKLLYDYAPEAMPKVARKVLILTCRSDRLFYRRMNTRTKRSRLGSKVHFVFGRSGLNSDSPLLSSLIAYFPCPAVCA